MVEPTTLLRPLMPWFGRQKPHDDFHIMLTKPIQAQPTSGGQELPVGPDFRVTVIGGPFGDVGVKALPVLYHRRQQQQVAAPAKLMAQSPAEFVARLGRHRNLAVWTKLRSQPGEEQPHEMINFRDGGHGALAPASAGALLDADRRREARDQVHVRTG